MNNRSGNVAHSYDRSDLSNLEVYASIIESMPAEERRLSYQECARFILIRHLIEKKLTESPLHEEECRPSSAECVAENADGICFLFYVRGSVWDVILSRDEVSKGIIEKHPDRLKDSKLFVMDLRKAAKVNLRTIQ